MSKPIYRPYLPNDRALIQVLLDDFAKSFQSCIPAVITEVISRGQVRVSPTIQMSDSDGKPIKWADITTTILVPFGGSVFLSMPNKVGDTGWLVGADMDTALFKKEKKPAQQQSFVLHQYQYGFFVPDMINGYSVSNEDGDAVVLSTLDGKTKISLKEKEINIVSDDMLKINAKSITIDSSNNNVVIDGINFKNHTHTVPSAIAVQVNPTTGEGATTMPATTSGVDDV